MKLDLLLFSGSFSDADTIDSHRKQACIKRKQKLGSDLHNVYFFVLLTTAFRLFFRIFFLKIDKYLVIVIFFAALHKRHSCEIRHQHIQRLRHPKLSQNFSFFVCHLFCTHRFCSLIFFAYFHASAIWICGSPFAGRSADLFCNMSCHMHAAG